jgi:hypothetical protein
MKKNNYYLHAVIVAIGLSMLGWFIGTGFVRSRTADRFVTVKGVSERDVEADVALWPLSYVATDDNLITAQKKIEQSKARILSFLSENSIDTSAIEIQGLEVNDTMANPYRSGPVTSRYIITQTLMVRSTEPAVIRNASQKINELVQAGVVLSSNRGPDSGPTFLFSRLNDLKPEMLAEATANARLSAEQFTRDSGSEVGAIRRANQGIFVIIPRDRAPGIMESNQYHKTVRVVSTIEYFLIY